jgi:hypothetical protein
MAQVGLPQRHRIKHKRAWSSLTRNLDFLDLADLRFIEIPIIGLLLFLAFDWRLCKYMWKGIWLDEAYAIMSASLSTFHDMILYKNLNAQNPALYEIICYLTRKWHGWHVEKIRLISIFVSAFAVYYVYRIARDWYGILAGIFASVIYIYQNYSINFAHEIRNYSLLGMFSISSLWFFSKWIADIKDKRFFALSLIHTLGAAYTHNFGLWIFLSEFIFLSFESLMNRDKLREYSMYILLFLIAYFPQGVIAISVFISGIENPYALKSNFYTFMYFIRYFMNGFLNQDFKMDKVSDNLISVIILIGLPVSMIISYFKGRQSRIFALIFFFSLLPMALHFIMARGKGALMDRYLMPFSIPMLLLVVAMLMSYHSMIRFFLSGLFLWYYLSNATPYSMLIADTHNLVGCIKEQNPSSKYASIIAPDWISPPILYYYRPEIFFDLSASPYDRFLGMKLSGMRSNVWLTNAYDLEREAPCWFRNVDTAIVITSNPEFLNSFSTDFHVENTMCQGLGMYVSKIYRRQLPKR